LKNTRQTPTLVEEKTLWDQGYRLVAGIDEAGRGALAGPVVAASVILPGRLNGGWVNEVRDSKQLSPARRDYLFAHIGENAISVGIGLVNHDVIDTRGIAEATRLAMRLAIQRLSPAPDFLLIDYMRLPVSLPQKGIVRGDQQCLSIACASIIAKVSRDRLMIELDGIYPGYRLAAHKGYGTKEHLSCLYRLGPCRIHRKSFNPLKSLISNEAAGRLSE